MKFNSMAVKSMSSSIADTVTRCSLEFFTRIVRKYNRKEIE